MVYLKDVLGEYKIDASHAREYVRTWFNDKDIIVISSINTVVARKVPESFTWTAKKFVEEYTDDLAYSAVFGSDGAEKSDLYINVCPVKDHMNRFQRGTEKDVDYIPGVYCDFDVKDGCFSSTEEILEYLNGLALKPTMVVRTGSGGVHGYWKLIWEEIPPTKQLIERWWAYLDEAAGEHRKIDKLIDTARMLRLPGSVYFPKTGSGGKIASNSLLETNTNIYTVEQILEVSEAAYGVKMAKRRNLQQREIESRVAGDSFTTTLMQANGNKWNTWRALAQMEDYVNNSVDWDEILPPFGWDMINDKGFERVWARPGRNERSATTDYDEGNGKSSVMSLFSESEDTGLADLRDAGIHLTKFRVMQRLVYKDDLTVMLTDLFDRIIGKV